ncbi:MAG: hypothetical protein II480_02220 [Bacteroidales bacterium]|nr:hypothetical protein [Bacteroidales bacterium]
MTMLLDNILNGLGSRSDGNESRSSGSSSTSTETSTTVLPSHSTGVYTSGDGEVETAYIDTTTGRKNYTSGDKAGTSEQVRPPSDKAGTSEQVRQPSAEEDDNMLMWLLLPLAAMAVVKFFKRKNGKRKSKR